MKPLEIVEKKLSEIKPYEHNAKLHNLEWIKRSIEEFRADQPIVVDGSGVIIKGHGRYAAAKELGYDTFPTIVREDLTEEQIKLARIADNRSSEAGWDYTLLEESLNDLGEVDLDLNEFGITEDWLDKMQVSGDVDLGEVPAVGSGRSRKEHQCPKCGFKYEK